MFDPISLAMMGSSILGSIFGSDPAEDAKKRVAETYAKGKEIYDPYMQAGQKAYGQMQPELEGMTSDPGGYYEKMMSGYKPSEGYQFKRDELMRALKNSAAAGGMAGSTQDMMNEGGALDKLLSGDMQQYFQDVSGLQGRGLQGEEGLYSGGFNASKALGDLLGQTGSQQADLDYTQGLGRNQMFSDLFSGIGNIPVGKGTLSSKFSDAIGNKLGEYF